MVSGPGPAPVLRGNNAHTATPSDGTYVREADGQPADVLNEADYPVSATCKICRGRIRLRMQQQWEWEHAPAKVTA